MNKKEQLLAEVLTHGSGESFARIAAAQARRRQTRKQLSRGAAAVTAVALAWFGLNRSSPPPRPAVAPPPAYEIISDAELLVQLNDQPVLLLKDRGRITGVISLHPAGGKL